MTGWIKIHRKITENPLWGDKPFSKGQAWIDLLISANRSPATLVYGNTIINLDRGQLHTSEIKLMYRWGWSKKKVRAYLLLLKSLKMATVEGTAKGTTITIENYGIYQDIGTAQDTDEETEKEPLRNRLGTAKGTQTRSKEREEGKEDKEVSIVPYETICGRFNFICQSLSKVVSITDRRKQKIRARWNELKTVEAFEQLFYLTEQSDFLCGRGKDWKCTFDWLMANDTNYIKVLEGNYTNKKPKDDPYEKLMREAMQDEYARNNTAYQGDRYELPYPCEE